MWIKTSLFVASILLTGCVMYFASLMKSKDNFFSLQDIPKNVLPFTKSPKEMDEQLYEYKIKLQKYKNKLRILKEQHDDTKLGHKGVRLNLSRTVLAIITSPKTMPSTTLLVASIHKHHPQNDMRIIIYGVNLPQTTIDLINVWSGVTFVDLASKYIAAQDSAEPFTADFENPSNWRLIALSDALNNHGASSVILLSHQSLLTGKISASKTLLQAVSDKGFFFGGAINKEKVPSSSEKHNKCFTDSHVIAVLKDSLFHKEYIDLSVECSKSECPRTSLDKLAAQIKLVECATNLETIDSQKTPSEDRIKPCSIAHRSDFYTFLSLPKLASDTMHKFSNMDIYKFSGLSGERKKVALGFPATTKGNPNPSLTNIPPAKIFIPSFLTSIKNDARRSDFHFILYLGFDRGDPFYDTPSAQLKLKKYFEDQVTSQGLVVGTDVSFKMIRTQNTRGWVVYYWNMLFITAMDDGCDYFYQLNDDIQFVSPNWVELFTRNLDTSPLLKGFGATGPTDSNNGNILTQSFVSRTHYNVFGYLYPYTFKNWYSDDWMSKVYVSRKSIFRSNRIVRNAQTYGTRYDICYLTGEEFNEILNPSDKRLEEFLKEHQRATRSIEEAS